MDISTATAVGKRSWRTTVIGYANIVLFLWFAYMTTSAILGTIGNGAGASDGVKYLIAVVACLFCLSFSTLGYWILRMSPVVYYFEDGFMIGKKGSLISYEGLQYHLTPGMKPNQFMQLYYKENGQLKRMNAQLYSTGAFIPLQENVVAANLPQALKKIENGETLEFKAAKLSLSFGTVKTLDRKIDNGIKVKINKESIALDDEVYPWSQYKITSVTVGTILVSRLDTGKKVVNFNAKYLIEQPNLVTALVNILGGSE